MLVYLLAGVLCCLYASDTVLVAHNYRFHASNPPSAQLLLLAEAAKLALSTCLHAWERCGGGGLAGAGSRHAPQGQPSPVAASKNQGLPTARSVAAAAVPGQQRPRRWAALAWHCLPPAVQAVLAFSVPAVCYCATNK